MKIGLIADTHMPGSTRQLWPQVFDLFKDIDIILHAGDLHTLSVVDRLEEIAPVYVARGNGDRGLEDDRLKDVWNLQFDGVQIGMVHHFPRPDRRTEQDVRKKLNKFFPEGAPDVVVYGHTHRESVDKFEGTLCINPGSPTLPRNLSLRMGTLGILEAEKGHSSIQLYQITADGTQPHDDY